MPLPSRLLNPRSIFKSQNYLLSQALTGLQVELWDEGGKKWKMPSFKYPYIMGWRNSLAMLRITVMFFQRTKVWVLTPVSDSSESPETATPRDPITSLGLYGHYNIHENTHKLFFFLIYKTILTIRSWGNGTIDSSPADPLTDSFIKPPILTDP